MHGPFLCGLHYLEEEQELSRDTKPGGPMSREKLWPETTF